MMLGSVKSKAGDGILVCFHAPIDLQHKHCYSFTETVIMFMLVM